LKVGDAADIAMVVAGGLAVAVAPVLKFVGSSDIPGRTGCVYCVPVAESPEPPPATSLDVEAAESARHTVIAATMATPPAKPANAFIRLTPISVLLLGAPGMAPVPIGGGRAVTSR
jgi:hypothetical protein